MEGCAGCFESQKGIDKQLSIAIAKAESMAKEQQNPIAIVREGSEFVFYDAFYAYQNGLSANIQTVVSFKN